jgi:hypothetical protein
MHARSAPLRKPFHLNSAPPMKSAPGLKPKQSAAAKAMTEQRFYFQVHGRIDCIWAVSRQEAQHKLMYSDYAPVYRYIQWL